MVAIPSINTCKRSLENCKQKLYIFLGKFIPQISFSVVHFLLIATANGVYLMLSNFPLSAVPNLEG